MTGALERPLASSRPLVSTRRPARHLPPSRPLAIAPEASSLPAPVPIPGRVWWREIRFRWLPAVWFLTVLALVAWLWCNQLSSRVVW